MTDESDKPAAKPVKKVAKVVPVTGTRPGKNGGKLNSGGSWPNSGRPPSELRALARDGVEKALPRQVEIAINADGSKRDADSTNAFNALVKLGVPQQHEVGENPDAPMLTDAERKARLKALLG